MTLPRPGRDGNRRFGTAVIGSAATIATFTFAESIQHRDPEERWHDHLDVNDDGTIDRDDERTFRMIARSFAVVSAVGTAVGIVGSVLLAGSLRPRANAPELRDLKMRRRELRRQLEYGGSPTPGGFTWSLRGRFQASGSREVGYPSCTRGRDA